MPNGVGLSKSRQSALNSNLSAWANHFGPRFVLGLSGGGDSMALALGCASWMQSGAGSVHAVCVDHGLRDGSFDEAQQTVTWAGRLGLTTQIVSLELERGKTRQQERAREGRHNALLSAAKTQKARVILLAHTIDDQHETVALRLASKTGLDGLAGMAKLAPSPFYHDTWPCLLGRPLLDVERAALRHDLDQAGQEWHDDPSNLNPAFARIRARARLSKLAAVGADTLTLGRIASQAAALRVVTDDSARALLSQADLWGGDAQISLSSEMLANAPAFAAQRVLGWLAFAVGGDARLAEFAKTTRLYDAVKAPDFRGVTLAHAKFERAEGFLIVTRAPARKNEIPAKRHKLRDITLRLLAISGDIDRFVTHLR